MNEHITNILTDRKERHVGDKIGSFLKSPILTFIFGLAFSIGGFYFLTNYRITSVESTVSEVKQDIKNINTALTNISNSVARIEGKLEK